MSPSPKTNVVVLVLIYTTCVTSQYPEDRFNQNHQYTQNPRDQYQQNQQYPQNQKDLYNRNDPYSQNSRDRYQYNPQYPSNQQNQPYSPNQQNGQDRQYSQNQSSFQDRQNSQNQPNYQDRQYFQNQPNSQDRQYSQNQQNSPDRQYSQNREYSPQNRDYSQQSSQNQPQSSLFPQSSQYPQYNYQQQKYGREEDSGDCCEDYCYSRDEDPYIYFATKTAYETVSKRRNGQQIVRECEPVQFWSINRHGTRLPGRSTIQRLMNLNKIQEEIIRNYEQKRSYPDRGRLCDEDLSLFKKWRWNDTINVQTANSLTTQGISDMKLLAANYKSKFPHLLDGRYEDTKYIFQYTDTDRTHDSYQAYIEGLFGNNAYLVHANVFTDDKLIKPYKSCKTWQDQVDNNPNTFDEYNRFIQKEDYQQMVRDVFRRLGYRYRPDPSIIKDMYDMCRYERAWYVRRRSPWCAAFTKNQLKLLEYAEDLRYFYNTGYGNEMNKKLGCPAAKDLYEKFEKTVNGNPNGNKVTIFFTHSASIQTFYTALGIAKDNMPLTADNYYQQNRRQWRTAVIDPFGSNLAAILYQCRSEQYKVMFFLNEVPVDFPECSVGLCLWSTVQQKLQGVAENCNLDFCNGNSGSVIQRSYFYFIVPLLVYAVVRK